ALNSDYQKALLYAAIAVESMAEAQIEDRHSGQLDSLRPQIRLRILPFKQAGGLVVRKYPIYEYLRRRKSFSVLLHELPLYVLGRSLLHEDQELYRLALKLYKTRNTLAHGRIPEDKDKEYQVSSHDAINALQCAKRVFEWYGCPTGFVLPV